MTVRSKVLLIRTDANTHIGTGHMMRCLALAQAWQANGGRVLFALAPTTMMLEMRLAAEEITIAQIKDTPGSLADASQTVNLAQGVGATWVALDGYHFDSSYQRKLKTAGLSLLCVDDYGHADYYWADLILNQNPYANESSYRQRETYTHLLLGTDYALLRREFWIWRCRQRVILPIVRRVLVTLGGSDFNNVTLMVIQALQLIQQPELEVKVVVGPANPHLDLLTQAIEDTFGNIKLFTAVTDMPSLMAWADLAVSAAGSTCWELAFMGIPLITIVLADNQRGIAASLAQAGISLNAGWHADLSIRALAETVAGLLRAPKKRHRMSEQGRALVDGLGAQRVATRLAAIKV